MTLVPFYDSVVSEDTANRLVALDGSTVEVLLRSDDSPAELFDDEAGTSPAANPVTVDSSGRFSCWVEGGQYNLVVTTPAGVTSVHPVDISQGGVDDTVVGVVHKALDETITGKKTFTPESVAPAITMEPLTDGYFMDFAGGPPGVVPQSRDPGTPHWFDSLTINGTLVYATDNLLSPLPGALKITSSSALASYGTWGRLAYRDLDTHYGRFYFYMDTNVAANTVPISWTTVGDINIRTSDRKFEIRNSAGTAQTLDNADTKSTNALLSAAGGGGWYRFEWKIVQSTSVGTITVKLFEGHDENPIETRVTNTFNTKVVSSTVQHGLTNAANLAGGSIRVAALAGGCLDYPGPYTGVAANMQVVTPDDLSLWEMLPGGQTIMRSTDSYHLGSGGDPKYEVKRGEPIFRTHPMGLMLGGNYRVGNPVTRNDYDPTDIFFDLQSRRVSARSYNLRIINDPADIAFERMGDPSVTINPNQPQTASGSVSVNSDFWKVGQGAVWSSSSKTVTWQTGDITLILRDIGHGIQLGGNPYATLGATHNYNIDEILSPTSCTLSEFPIDSSPATTATGVNALNSTTINCGSTTDFNSPQASTTATGVNATNSATINCGSTTGFASFGYAYLGETQFYYSNKTGSSFTGCGPHAATTGGEAIVTDRPTAWLAGTAFTYSGLIQPAATVATTTPGDGTHNEVQTVRIQNATGGTFTITFGANTTSGIASFAAQATVQTALEGLASIGAGNIGVVRSGASDDYTYTLTFQGALALTNVNQVTCSTASLLQPMFTGCSSHAATTGGEAITQGAWRLKGFPYPSFVTGVSSGAGCMQLKAFPHAFAYKGKDTAGMNTQSGTFGVGVAFTGGGYTWTSEDAGRHLLIHDDPSIVGSGKDSFIVRSVNSTTVNGAQALGADPFNVASTAGFADSGKAMCGTTAFRYTGRTATSFTGTTSVPVTAGGEAIQALTLATSCNATLVDTSYRVAGHDREQSAQPIQTPSNLTVDANAHICNFGTSGPACMTGSVNWLFKFNQTNTLFINTTSGGYTATPQVTHFQIRSDGTWGYGADFPAAQIAVTQITSKSTGVTINGPGGQITMNSATLNASTSVGFTVTNDRVATTDVVIVNIKTPGATTATGVNALNSATMNVGSTSSFSSSGEFTMGGVLTSYTGKTANSFTGCGAHAATVGGEAITQGATATSYLVGVDAVADGSFKIHLRNVSAGNLTETPVLSFAIVKGPTV